MIIIIIIILWLKFLIKKKKTSIKIKKNVQVNDMYYLLSKDIRNIISNINDDIISWLSQAIWYQ